MKIKRTALIVIIITVCAVLFSSSVFGDTSPQPRETQVNSSVISNVTFNIKVSRFYTDASVALQGGGTLPYFVSIAIINNNDEPALINGLRYKIVFAGTDTYYYQGYDNYSYDLFTTMLPTDANSYISVASSADYSYGNGIVVPPHKAMYLCCVLELATTLDQSTMTWPTPTMNHVYFPNDITVTTGDYPYSGEPVDYTPVLTAIYNLNQTTATQSQLTSVLTALDTLIDNSETELDYLADIIDTIAYTGGGFVPNSATTALESDLVHTLIDENSDYSWFVFRFAPVYSVNDFELDSTSDTLIQNQIIERHIFVRLLIRNNSSNYIKFFARNSLRYIIPSGNIAYYVDSLYSNIVDDIYFTELNSTTNGRRMYFGFKNTYDNWYYLPPGKTGYMNVHIVLKYNSTVTPSWNTPVISWNTAPSYVSGGYYPMSEYEVLRDLYLAYSQVNGLDDFENDSDSLDTTGSQVHTQEQTYYTANRSAIEATGLQNYQFSQDQTNGIGAVSNDFTALWNAMGSWTSVYIFSLTIGLAMMILRHVPSMVISHRGKTEDD